MEEKKIILVRRTGFDIVVIAVFFAAILAGILVPVYADEVAIRIMRSTFFTEQGRILTLMPQCNGELGLSIPLSWIPAAIGTSLLGGNSAPIWIRLTGLATAVLWVALLAIIVHILIPNRMHQLRWLAAMLAFLGVGVLPFTLVLARSEQWLLLFLTTFTLLPFVGQRISWIPSRSGLIGLLILFCLLVSFTFYAHPKALFFLPLLGVSAYCSFYSRSHLAFFVATAFLSWTSFQTIEITRLLVSCPDAPLFAAYMASQTIKLSMLLQAPVTTLWELVANFTSAPDLIVKHLLFRATYQSAWLAPAATDDIGRLAQIVNGDISSEIWLVIWSGCLLPIVAFGVSIRRGDFGQLFMILAALWVGVVGHLAVYKVWNFYGGALVLGLSVLLIFLSAVQIKWLGQTCLVCRWTYMGVCLIFLASAYVLAIQVVPVLFRAIGSEQIGLKDQPLSVPAFGFSEQRQKIRIFAQQCSLEGDGMRRLVVDDLTYFAFDKLREPLHLVYFYESGFGLDVKGEASIRMLNKLGIAGIVAQCTFMPSLLLKLSHKEGNLCCIKFPLENVN